MAPPVEEPPTKVVKVATTVVRRQSTKTEETKSTNPPAMEDDLHLTVLEESFRSAHSGYEGRSVVIPDTPCGFVHYPFMQVFFIAVILVTGRII